MDAEQTLNGDDETFQHVLIKLDGFPIYTCHFDLTTFINSILVGSLIHPNISLPHPTSFHLVRTQTELTAHAILKFDWSIGCSEEEADNRLTEILEACHRLKIAELTLPSTIPTPKIEPVLVCLNAPVPSQNPTMLNSNEDNQPIVFTSFARYIQLPHRVNKKQKRNPSSKSLELDCSYDSPRDYSNDDKLKDIEFVKSQHIIAKEKKKTYLAAEKLLRMRNMPWADRLKP